MKCAKRERRGLVGQQSSPWPSWRQQLLQACVRQGRHRRQLIVQLAPLKVDAAVEGVAHNTACSASRVQCRCSAE